MDTKVYIFSLDYGNRIKEKKFIKEVLKCFDEDTVVGCGIFVNNNPYSLELLFYVSLAKEFERFEEFLRKNYKNKRRIFNYFLDEMLESFSHNGYNIATFIDVDTVDIIMTEEENNIFLFPGKRILKEKWGIAEDMKKFPKVFLSHSSKDKKIIDRIFNEFQKNQIHAWYDKYQIEPGDSITEKINQGLDESDIGIICISNNFLDATSGWTKNELNFFIQRRMYDPNKNFIILNFDVPHNKLPPLVQDFKYINFKEEGSMDVLIDTLKKHLNENS